MSDGRPLAGKTALITGAAGAIGKATAILLARRGAAVVAVDINGQALEALQMVLPGDAGFLGVVADMKREAEVADCVQKAVRCFGQIDIFFNNAGIEGPVVPLTEYELESFESVIAVNVTGVFLGLKHVLPVMYRSGRGSVVNTSSIAGLVGSPNMIGYTASKHAVVGLTRAAAAEAAPKGVRVNCINPGPIESPMMRSVDASRGDGAAASAALANPSGRYGLPDEVAGLVAFLASDEASYCNGGCFPVDGGLSAVLSRRASRIN